MSNGVHRTIRERAEAKELPLDEVAILTLSVVLELEEKLGVIEDKTTRQLEDIKRQTIVWLMRNEAIKVIIIYALFHFVLDFIITATPWDKILELVKLLL